MNTGQQPRTVIEGMDHHLRVVRLGQRKDVAQGADATHLGRAGLHHIDGAHTEQVLELHQRGGILAGGDRDGALLAQGGQSGIVLRRPQGLFQPP